VDVRTTSVKTMVTSVVTITSINTVTASSTYSSSPTVNSYTPIPAAASECLVSFTPGCTPTAINNTPHTSYPDTVSSYFGFNGTLNTGTEASFKLNRRPLTPNDKSSSTVWTATSYPQQILCRCNATSTILNLDSASR
jgi:hypothetical protein